MTQAMLNEMRDEKTGQLPKFAWPGGYPIFYLAKDNGVLCPACANKFNPATDNDDQLEPVAADVNYEDAQLFCEHCNKRIESAYAEDDAPAL